MAEGQGGVERKSDRAKSGKLKQEMRSDFQSTSREIVFKYIRCKRTGKWVSV